MRLLEEAVAVLQVGTDYTFWVPGVSQGHSDAVRRVEGVKDARQCTIPIGEAGARGHFIKFRLRLDRDPAFTASVLLA